MAKNKINRTIRIPIETQNKGESALWYAKKLMSQSRLLISGVDFDFKPCHYKVVEQHGPRHFVVEITFIPDMGPAGSYGGWSGDAEMEIIAVTKQREDESTNG